MTLQGWKQSFQITFSTSCSRPIFSYRTTWNPWIPSRIRRLIFLRMTSLCLFWIFELANCRRYRRHRYRKDLDLVEMHLRKAVSRQPLFPMQQPHYL